MRRRFLSMLGLGGAVLVASVTLLGRQTGAGATDPTFSVSPTTATPGQTITFSGTGWTCALGVHILGARPDGSVFFAATVRPSASGSISGSFTGPTPLGHYTVVAHDGRLGCGPLIVTLDVVVAAPPTTTTTARSTSTTTALTTATFHTAPPPTAHAAPVTHTPLPVTG